MRNEMKLSQTQLAKSLEVSQTTINAWEKNKQSPSIEKLNKLAILFKVDTNYLSGSDYQTLKDIIKITSQEYIYSSSNFLNEETISKITKLLNIKNKIKNNKFKIENQFEENNQLVDIDFQILDLLLVNQKIKFNLFNNDYQKPIYNDENMTTTPNTICSFSQKHLINEILVFTDKQCNELLNFIYHIKKETRILDILNKILFMDKESIEKIYAQILGFEESKNNITNIINNFNGGKNE